MCLLEINNISIHSIKRLAGIEKQVCFDGLRGVLILLAGQLNQINTRWKIVSFYIYICGKHFGLI